MKAKMMKAVSRTTAAPAATTASKAAAADHGFGQLARGIGRYLADLDGFADGDFGPVPDAVAEHVRGMAENTRAELAELALVFGRG